VPRSRPVAAALVASTLLCIVVLGIGAGLTSACREAEEADGTSTATATTTTLAFPTTDSHEAGVELPGGLVTTGLSPRCRDCHEEIFEAYETSGMHDTMMLPGGERSIEAGLVGRVIVHRPTGLTARFDVIDGRYVQTLFYADPTGVVRTSFSAPIDLVIGSGHATRSYLQVRDGRFLELPLTWYRELNGLALSPGPGFQERVLRHADTLCIACHTGTVTPVRHDASVGFTGHLSLGVTCERCHGPSDDHVETGDVRTTVNPARLPPDRQEQICLQCHLSEGITVSATDRTISTYVPGDDLADWVSIFRPEQAQISDHAEIAGHGSRLRQSACFTMSADSANPLTCTTCHNPHRGFKSDDTTRATDRGCLVCHDQKACHSKEGSAGNRACFSCHMTVAPASDVAHTKVTDHWIRRKPPPPTKTKGHLPHAGDLALAGGRLVDVLDPDGERHDAALRAALAYARGAEMARVVHDQDAAEWRKRAYVLAGAHLLRNPDDPHALRVRGRMMTFAGNAEGARPLLESARRDLPGLPGPTAELAYAMAEDSDFVASERLLAHAQELDPYDEDVATAHARVLVELGRRDDAVRVLEALREKLGPSITRAHLASDIANGGGDLPAALRHAYDVLMFLPRQPDVHTKIGELLGAIGESERARMHLTEALRIAPNFAPARRILTELERR